EKTSLSSKREEEEEKLHSHRSPSVVGRASHCRYVREDLLLLFSLSLVLSNFSPATLLLLRWSSGSVSGKR
ncbi:unnamed protein product, partial [Brassica rapa subsp. narinosa]